MVLGTVLSALPLALPLSCWTGGCTCEWICPTLGAAGCVLAAAASSAVLYSGFALVDAMAGLDALRD